MKELLKISERIVGSTELSFKRYLFEKIDFGTRLIIIKGARGVGKTTLLQQYIKEHYSEPISLWMSLDHIIFSTVTLIAVIDYYYAQGYKVFALDEVHKYPDWSIEVKNIYDTYPDVKLLLSASSALDIMKGMADLSRRADVYHLRGLSFREYLILDHDIHIDKVNFNDLLENHIEIAENITQEYNIPKLFSTYLKSGYYPFFTESKRRYHDRLQSVINQVIEVDLPPIFSIDYRSVRQVKKLLALIARLVPFSPDINQLSRDVGIGRNRILMFLDYLNSAGLIHLLKSAKKSDSIMAKPDKIFLENTNLIHALGLGIANTETIRETFIINALSATEIVSTPSKGDFMINNQYVAEVGDKSKSFHQLEGIPNAFLIKDDILIGREGVVPLWVFGFGY